LLLDVTRSPLLIPRDGCEYTHAVELCTGKIPGPATIGCAMAGDLNPVSIRPSPANTSLTGGEIKRTPIVVKACPEHARMLRAMGCVAD
jgi:hypothetical protein